MQDLEATAKKLDGISSSIKLVMESPRFEDIDPDIIDSLEYLTSDLYRTSADIYDVILDLDKLYHDSKYDNGPSPDRAALDELAHIDAELGLWANLDGVSMAFQDTGAEGEISEMGQATIQASTPADDKH
jgi:hypothetical protein